MCQFSCDVKTIQLTTGIGCAIKSVLIGGEVTNRNASAVHLLFETKAMIIFNIELIDCARPGKTFKGCVQF